LWTSSLEREFAKDFKLKSLPILEYLTEPQIKKLLKNLELTCTPVEFLLRYGLEALEINDVIYLHPEVFREFVELYFSS